MRIKDLHLLPKFRDGWSYLYVEHCRIDRDARAVAIHDVKGVVPVPCASLALLMLGPGVSITHAAVMTLADNGCLVAWCGEEGVRFYAAGLGKTRSAANLLHQARLWADPKAHLDVVRRMYGSRFPGQLPAGLSLQHIRGMEGIRVREAYAKASRESGVEWKGRNYRGNSWAETDPVNRALSAANSCLYGLCHAAILSSGFSPALGFIHTGKMLSFVYDVADLYKADVSVPVAFREAARGTDALERRVRLACRDAVASSRLLARIVDDIYRVLGMDKASTEDMYASDEANPGRLWDSEGGTVDGGVNHADLLAGEEVKDGSVDSGSGEAGPSG
jgi:CRISPR-associated protein Cas1